MADKTPEERAEKLQRAKRSMRVWMSRERSWDYNQLKQWCPEPVGRLSLLTRLQKEGHFIINPPDEEELSAMTEASTLAQDIALPAVEPAKM